MKAQHPLQHSAGLARQGVGIGIFAAVGTLAAPQRRPARGRYGSALTPVGDLSQQGVEAIEVLRRYVRGHQNAVQSRRIGNLVPVFIARQLGVADSGLLGQSPLFDVQEAAQRGKAGAERSDRVLRSHRPEYSAGLCSGR